MKNILKSGFVFGALTLSALCQACPGVTLIGTSADDTVYTDGGSLGPSTPCDDVVKSKGGRDIIYVGDGNDTVFGGDGNDHIVGGAGNDVIYGERDRDTIYGGDGDDFLKGGRGDDLIKGENGDDVLYGGPGNDIIYGGNGQDTIYPGRGNNVVFPGNGLNITIVPITSSTSITSGDSNGYLVIKGDEPLPEGNGILMDDAGGVMTVIFESLYITDMTVETAVGSTVFKTLNGQTILTYTTPKIVTMETEDHMREGSVGGLKVIFASD